MDCLNLLLNYVYAAFESKQVVVAMFLDIEGAFDNVDINILCNQLSRLEVPPRVTKITWALTSD